MNYGQLRGFFKTLLNRNDCDDALADSFLELGIRKVERALRTSAQKSERVRIINSMWSGYELVPEDLSLKYYISVDGMEVKRITEAQAGILCGYYVDGPFLRFYPDLQEGQELRIMYYAQWVTGLPDDAETAYTKIFSDVVTYASLIYAADYFEDSRISKWSDMYTSLLAECQMFSDIDEAAGLTQMISYGNGVI